MVVCVLSARLSLLAIFVTSLLLCIISQSAVFTSQTEEDGIVHAKDSTDESNSTSSIDKLDSESNNVEVPVADTDVTQVEVPPIVNDDVLVIPNEHTMENVGEQSHPLPSSSVVDEQLLTTSPSTSDEQQQTTTPSSVKKNLSSINSFEEWKQQQLHAELLKGTQNDGNGGTTSDSSSTSTGGSSSSTPNQQHLSASGSSKKAKLRKNFASASCGAKILAHNAEAQNPASVLYSSLDDYMLNPCNVKIWFVVELCESIRIRNVEIANFELFSSVPKSFRVSASDRYPTKEWHRNYLGIFNASFSRTIQSFQTIQSTIYLKYVKFELIDFHGREHYCPLSVVRVHGSNVEDEIMTMEENTAGSNNGGGDETSRLNLLDEGDDDEDPPLGGFNDLQVGGIIGSAIIDLAKKVFGRQTIRGTASSTLIAVTETMVLKTDCHAAVNHPSINNGSVGSWRAGDMLKRCIAVFLQGLWSTGDLCMPYTSLFCLKSNPCCQCSSIDNSSHLSMTMTRNLFIDSCGYYHLLTNRFVCQQEKLNNSNETQPLSLITNIELTQEFSEKNLTTDKINTTIQSEESIHVSSNQTVHIPEDAIASNETPAAISQPSNQSNEQAPSAMLIPDESTLILQTVIPSNVTNLSSSQANTVEPMHVDLPVGEASPINIVVLDEIVTSSPPPSSSSTHNNNHHIGSSSSKTNGDATLPLIPSPWLKGMLINTKSLPELFKIIEKLYVNLTLSNRYLQELSQHYVKKLDETQQTTDLLLNASKAADDKLRQFEERLIVLQENFDEVTHRLLKIEAWLPLFICMIICLFVWSLWSTCRIVRLRRQLRVLVTTIDEQRDNLKSIQEIDDSIVIDDDNADHPIFSNGIDGAKQHRKASSDSIDSSASSYHRSQCVPDSNSSIILENGVKSHRSSKKKSSKNHSNKTRNLLSFSVINS